MPTGNRTAAATQLSTYTAWGGGRVPYTSEYRVVTLTLSNVSEVRQSLLVISDSTREGGGRFKCPLTGLLKLVQTGASSVFSISGPVVGGQGGQCSHPGTM